jgi:OFA family oxalate/formate antiporter-like MFS transporter
LKISYRWLQMIALLMAMVMIANLQYSWTLFVKPIQDAHGWSLSNVQWAFTLFIVFQTWVQPFDGWLIDRIGLRFFFTLAGILAGVGWAALGFVQTLPQLYAAYALAGAGAALVYSGCIGSVLKWFRDRRGLASGIIAAGYGAGSALFIPIIVSLIESRGYRQALVWTGIVPGLVIMALAQFVRHPTAEEVKQAAVSTKTKSAAIRRNDGHFTTGEMLRTVHFYVLFVMFVMMAAGGLFVTANAGPVARSWGLPIGALALATAMSPLANGSSRIFWGAISDRLGRENTMAIAFALDGLALASVMVLGPLSGTLFTLTLVLMFFAWGGTFALFPSILGDWFGSRHATSNYSFLYAAKGVASILAGGIAALMYQHFGNWSAVFYGSAAMALVSAVLALVLRATPLPHKEGGFDGESTITS